jgi:uncharacterized damage-inducible protein DinB
MNKTNKREVWQRGPIDGISPLLQPVAHALLQAREEVNELMIDFPEVQLWEKPAGVASVGFHLQHLAGVLDRLFSYANGQLLSEEQLRILSLEGKPTTVPVQSLVEEFNMQVDKALKQLSNTEEETLTEARGVGRSQIPSTVLGLLVHSAEHTMRHVGQLLVTTKFVLSSFASPGKESMF